MKKRIAVSNTINSGLVSLVSIQNNINETSLISQPKYTLPNEATTCSKFSSNSSLNSSFQVNSSKSEFTTSSMFRNSNSVNIGSSNSQKKISEMSSNFNKSTGVQLLDALLVDPQVSDQNAQHSPNNTRLTTEPIAHGRSPAVSQSSTRTSILGQRQDLSSQLVISSPSPHRSALTNTMSIDSYQNARHNSTSFCELNDLSQQSYIQSNTLTNSVAQQHHTILNHQPKPQTSVSQLCSPVPIYYGNPQNVCSQPHSSAYITPTANFSAGIASSDYPQNIKDMLQIFIQNEQMKNQAGFSEKMRQPILNQSDPALAAIYSYIANPANILNILAHNAEVRNNSIEISNLSDQKQSMHAKSGLQQPTRHSKSEVGGQHLQHSYDTFEKNVRVKSANHDPRTNHNFHPPDLTPWSSSTANGKHPELLTSTIDILRESKQVASAVTSDFMQPRSYPISKLQTTSGVFFPEKQIFQPQLSQTDPVDRHFHISLKKDSSGFVKPERENMPIAADESLENRYMSVPSYNHRQPISPCSSSSSISSSVFDRETNSPGRSVKPFPNPQKRSTETDKSDACRYSLKKRLIQRYQADGAASLHETETAVVKTEPPFHSNDAPNNLHAVAEVKIEASNSAPDESKVSPRVEFSVSDAELASVTIATRPSSSSAGSNLSIANGSFIPTDDVVNTKQEATKKVRRPRLPKTIGFDGDIVVQGRRHPPVRATKTALMNNSTSLNESAKPARRNKKTINTSDGVSRKEIPKTGILPVIMALRKSRFFEKPRRSRTASLRESYLPSQPNSPTDGSVSLHDFDFNGQDGDDNTGVSSSTTIFSVKSSPKIEEEIEHKNSSHEAINRHQTIETTQKCRTARQIATSDRKRKAVNNVSSKSRVGPGLPLPVSDNSMHLEPPVENPAILSVKRRKRTARRSGDDLVKRPHSQRNAVLNALPSYADNLNEEDDDSENEMSTPVEPITTSSITTICRRCEQPLKITRKKQRASSPDCFDLKCDEQRSLNEIRRSLPAPPDLSILSHRSLCGGGELDFDGDDDPQKLSGQPFLQLSSCTELDNLKSSLRCRACREMSRISPMGRPKLETPSTTKQNHRRRGYNRQIEDCDAEKKKAGNGVKSSSTSQTQHANTVSVFCRFWGFRKLAIDNKCMLNVTDFCRTAEADSIDRSIWAMHQDVKPTFDKENAQHCIDCLGPIACRFLLSELSILSNVSGANSGIFNGRYCPNNNNNNLPPPYKVIAWKRPVQGVREMCDVCETTMFNSHWVCTKCGYSVCSACYYAKATHLNPKLIPTVSSNAASNGTISQGDIDVVDRCTGTKSKINSDVSSSQREDKTFSTLESVSYLGCENLSVRQPWATCSASRRSHIPSKLMLTALLPYGSLHGLWHRLHRIVRDLNCVCRTNSRTLLSSTSPADSATTASPAAPTDTSAATSLDLLAELALKGGSSEDGDEEAEEEKGRLNAVPSFPYNRQPYATSSSASVLYLPGPDDPHNLKAFKQHWSANQPVVISDCLKNFSTALWNPRSLSRDGDSSSAVLVDCETNLTISRPSLRNFWEAFESNTKKTTSKEGKIQHLRIREWPPVGDLAEVHPERFTDFMSNLPMSEYTHRDGQLNLAARLPSFFVRPDLGPRLHIAHDLSTQPKIGSTNLRVDVTDVMNILMHLSRPLNSQQNQGAVSETPCALRSVLRSSHVDISLLDQVVSNHDHPEKTNISSEKGFPGALWHIFLPSDLPRLREYLTELERSFLRSSTATESVAASGDVIHDQRIYLSQEHLDELHKETGIKPFTIFQFLGDAVFIPAGSVHQVRNLASCINISSDFISAEHVPQSLALTEEFRRLPRNHPSHEDKLQVKNLIYHTVKDALSVLLFQPQETVTKTDL